MSAARLDAGPDTVHWGYLDANIPARHEVKSGDLITISTLSGASDQMPPPPLVVPDSLSAIHAHVERKLGSGHICTGPVAVRGARPGHTLQVDIQSIELQHDWGYNVIRPLAGALPHDFDEARLIHVAIDRDRRIGRLPWGTEVPLRPFFGVMAVAPPPAWGTVSTIPPRRNGGNLDNKELIPGSTLYLPVFVDEALFSVGDGHGVQGDGEVCLSALETGLLGTFRLTVRDDMQLQWPMAETPTHIITMGFDPDLDQCVVIALRQMLDLICAKTAISRYSAHTLCSLAADLRITQVVNENKGVHLMLEKRYFADL